MQCHPQHEKHVPRVPDYPLPVNVSRMVADLAAKF
jgi:hypothetical protein